MKPQADSKSDRIRVATVVGARPQFVKASVLSRLFAADDRFDELVIHTGQHFDDAMSQVFFDELEMSPAPYNLGVGSGNHGMQTGRMLEKIEEVLLELGPDGVLVYGDTNSTLAGVLAAVKMHIPVAHVEAGLRSFNLRMPEEVNRVLADHVSSLLFAPTDASVGNLEREGLPAEKIFQVGDVMYDAALHYGNRARERSRLLEDLGLAAGDYVLATVHRAENVDDSDRLAEILEGLTAASSARPVVFPLHPRTAAAMEKSGAGRPGGIRFIPPVGYLDMLFLEQFAGVVATDSGGVQKEAFFFGVPCVILRDETEWVELVDLGWNRVVTPLSAAAVANAIGEAFGRKGRDGTPYGDGKAGERILAILEEQWREGRSRVVPAAIRPDGASVSRL
ncbi:MAG: non-hydrolyzing UDP-N-acetylglucosamine 2-epimerase [Thermoanaerobaculia bacterium]